MRPHLRELASAIQQVVRAQLLVGTEAREEHLILRRPQDVHVVDLQQAELADRASQMACVDPRGARAIEALGSQRDAPRLA